MERIMEIGLIKLFIYFFVGAGSGLLITYLGSKYHDKRFVEMLYRGRKGNIIVVLTSLLSGVSLALFVIYGNGMVKSFSMMILLGTLMVISRFDKLHKIIPNRILLILLAIRIVTMTGEIVIDKNDLIVVLVSSIIGAVYGSIVFVIVRLFSKNSIGLGDIKLFAIVGLYIGSTAIMPALFVSSLFALIYGCTMIARKAISKKDTMSFGPFIAAGTIIVMILGI